MNDSLGPTPTWRRIAVWQIAGLLLATMILGSIGVAKLALGRDGLALSLWPTVFAGSAFWILSTGVFMLPLTVAGLFAWTRIARRFPSIERGYPTLVISLCLLALLISFITGAINNWEVAIGQVEGEFWREAIRGIRYVFIPVALGLIVPRLLIPALRPGAFVGELRAAAV